tara:strand:- start:4269 stop:4535 length:267 start_codon:yes stop_codon:yes gene_type:complete
MTKEDILDIIVDKNNIEELEFVLLAEGFEEAFVGVTVTSPKKVIYDYWKCLDCIIRKEGVDFDDALDFLEEFVEEDLGDNTPIYIKKI